jgi:hypothetical protein
MFARDEFYLSDWVILTVLLNNLEFTFNVFVMTKRQFICVTTSTFNFLVAELIDEARMKNNKSSCNGLCDKSNDVVHFSVHTVRRLIMRNPCALSNTLIRRRNSMQQAAKKNKLSSSDKFLSKFFNNVKSTFNKTDDNVTTLSFMFVIGSHLMSV